MSESKQQIIKRLDAASRTASRLAAKQKRRLRIVFAVQVPCGTQMISSSIWRWLAATEKKIKFLSFEQRTIFYSWSDLLLQRVAGSREPVPASEGPGLRMGHFSSGAPPGPSRGLAF